MTYGVGISNGMLPCLPQSLMYHHLSIMYQVCISDKRRVGPSPFITVTFSQPVSTISALQNPPEPFSLKSLPPPPSPPFSCSTSLSCCPSFEFPLFTHVVGSLLSPLDLCNTLKNIQVYTVGQNHVYLYGLCTVFLAGKLPNTRSYTVYTFGSGKPYKCSLGHP